MRRFLVVAAAVLLPVVARPADAQSAAGRVQQLAQFLAPTGEPVVCQSERTALDTDAPTRVCRWQASASPRRDTMVLMQYGPDSVSLQLDHQFPERAAAVRFLDSLAGFGRRLDLTMRECGVTNTPAGNARGRLWLSEYLIVHATEFDMANALPRVMIVATNVPNEFLTGVMCPGAEFGSSSTR